MADIMTPALGESVTEATVAKWTKKTGETVKRDELIVELETDKVSLEVVAPEDGVLAIAAEEGATVTPGQKLGSVGAAGAQPAAAPAAAPVAPPEPAKTDTPATPPPAPAPATASMPLSPSVQRIVAENKLDPRRHRRFGKRRSHHQGRRPFRHRCAAARRGRPDASTRAASRRTRAPPAPPPNAKSACACRASARPSPGV